MSSSVKNGQHQQSQHAFPTKQIAILALCRVAEPIAMCSIFPYVFPQVISFLPAGSKGDNVGLYTGIIISSFAFAQFLSSVVWGHISDKYGRKPCLIFGLMGTLLSLQIYGFANNLWVAVFGRALGGILNGNVGVMQTMVAEIATRKEHQTKAFAVLPFVWAIGSIFGPALGGGLADPAKIWPSVFPEGSFFYRYPWALPNIACGALVFASIIVALGWLEETNESVKGNRDLGIELRKYISGFFCGNSGDSETKRSDERIRLLSDTSRAPSYSATPSVETPNSETSSGYFNEKQQPSAYTAQVVLWVAAYGILSYHANTFEHLLPIVLQADQSSAKQWWLLTPSGLGFSSQLVGTLYVAQGAFGIFVQFFVFPSLTTHYGVLKVYVWGTITYPILYFATPYLVLFREPYYWPPVVIILVFKMLWECCVFPCLFILLTNSVKDPKRMGSINGIAASVAACTKAIGPGLSGWVYDWGVAHSSLAAAWFICGFIAIVGAVMCGWLKDGEQEEKTGEPLFIEEPAAEAAAVAAMAVPVAVRADEGSHAAALLATSVQAHADDSILNKDLFGVQSRELRYESDSSGDNVQRMKVVVEESEGDESE